MADDDRGTSATLDEQMGASPYRTRDGRRAGLLAAFTDGDSSAETEMRRRFDIGGKVWAALLAVAAVVVCLPYALSDGGALYWTATVAPAVFAVVWVAAPRDGRQQHDDG